MFYLHCLLLHLDSVDDIAVSHNSFFLLFVQARWTRNFAVTPSSADAVLDVKLMSQDPCSSIQHCSSEESV